MGKSVETEIQLSMRPLGLAWLGAPLITYANQTLTFRTRKALALLVYLTTETGIHTREKLTALFWPESDMARGRGMLRTSLAYLRETLDAIDTPYLIVEPQTLRFDFNRHVDLDLHHVQAGLDALQRQPAPAARGRIISQLQKVVNQYRGDFLEGFSLADAPAFDDWASLQREHWHNRMHQIFDTLSQWQFEAGDLPAALETARRWKAHDLYGEHAPQRLMQIYYANGNRADALQVYDDYAKMLAAVFGGKPSSAIKTLAARIRAKAPARPVRAQAPSPVPSTDLAFVGRADELTRLMAAYHAACQGRTQVVILEGEAGIGKTRLAAEFLRWATAQGADILAGRAFETGGELPYQPLAELLRHQLEQEQSLTDLLSTTWLTELSRLLPEVRDRYPDLPQPDANHVTAQSRLLESITRLGQALAERAPLVLFLDDIQWADLPSLDALQYAMAQWTEHKTTLLLLLCTRHSSATATNKLRQWVTSLKAKLAVTQVALAPLTVEDTLALVSSLESAQTGAGHTAQPVEGPVVEAPTLATNSVRQSEFKAFAQALFDETEGQPLYLVETIKSLLEQKVLIPYHTAAGTPGVRWKTLAGETTGQLPLPRIIPNSVREAIQDRLARLTPTATALLSTAAVLGQAATFGQLTEVSGLEQMVALDALEELVAKRLLVESGQAAENYLIAHDKIRDVVYNESSAVRRKVLHRRAVAALREGDPARVAYHAQAAEMDVETFQASVGAGDAALHLFAASEAIAHYATARKLIATGQVPQVELNQIRHLYLSLGRALELNAQFEQAGVIYEELKTIAQRRAAPALTLVALTAQISLWSMASQSFNPVQGEALAQEALHLARQLSDPVAVAKILWGQMNFHLLANRLPEALRCGDQALTLARDLNLREQTAYILNDMVKCYLISGSLERADQAARETTELWRALNNLPMLADSLAGAASIARWTGDYDQALALSAEAYNISQSIANVWGLSYSQMTIGAILWDRGQPEQAIAVMEDCLRLAEQANYLLPQILTRTDLGATYSSLGDMQRGFEYMRVALQLADTRLPMFRPYVIGMLARQHLLYNQFSEAEALIEQAKTETNPRLLSFLFQWVRFAEAELALRQGNFERTLAVTDAILDSIRQSGMRSLLTRVLFMRGACCEAMGQPEAARAALLEARAASEKSGSRWMLMHILTMLAGIEGDPTQAEHWLQQAAECKTYILSHAPPELRAAFRNREAADEARQAASVSTSSPVVHDWGEMPTIGQFHGREQELAMVSGWLQEGPRIVALLGIGGVGKTTLAAQTVRQMADRFDVIIWSSLLNAPPLSEILRHWLQTLSRQAITALGTSLDDQIRQLLELLRQQHCLLILDNMESILHSGPQADASAGKLRPGYEGYEQLLHSLSSGVHRSTLLLTSREEPSVLSRWQGQTATMRVLHLSGLPVQAGQALLQAQGLVPSERTASALVQQYSGNPLALQIVSRTILDLYNGDIDAFTKEGFPIFDDIRTVLDQQFERLSELERELLIWLAIEREPVTAPALRPNLVDQGSQRAFLEALRSLQQRSLLEKSGDGFTLQNVVIEYVTDRLIEGVSAELINFDRVTGWPRGHPVTLSLLNRHALVKAEAKAYVRQSQRRLILQPLAARLQVQLGQQRLQQTLQRCLAQLRALGPAYAIGIAGRLLPGPPGYAAGNILNLLLHLEFDLAQYDFSQLCVWQADLRGAQATALNFAEADLSHSAFTLAFDLAVIKYAADGQVLVAGCMDGELCLWRAAGGQLHHAFRHAEANASPPIIISQDSQWLASSGLDFVIRLWSIEHGKSLRAFAGHTDRLLALAMSTDGRLAASSSLDGTIRIWDIDHGQLRHILVEHADAISALAFRPDGKCLAGGGGERLICLWDTESGQLLQTLRGHVREIECLAFSSDGTMLVSGAHDGTIYLWDVASGQLLRSLAGHSHIVRAVLLHSNDRLLASSGADCLVRLWDLQRGELVHTFSGHTNDVQSLSFSVDGAILASGGKDNVVQLWDTQTGHALDVLRGHVGVVNVVRFDPTGRLLASSGVDGLVRLWAVRAGEDAFAQEPPGTQSQMVKYLQGHAGEVRIVAFHPAGRLLACGGVDHHVRLWDVVSGKSIHLLRGHTNSINALAFSPDGCWLASGGPDRTIRLWPVGVGPARNSQDSRVLHGHDADISALAFSPDGRTLVSCSLDHTARLWSIDSGRELHLLRGHPHALSGVVFSPDGQLVVTSSYDYSILVWDTGSGQRSDRWHDHAIRALFVAFDATGELFACITLDQNIEIRRVATGALLHTLSGHTKPIISFDFSPTEPILASAGWDGTIRLWNTETGACLQTLRAPGPYAGMNITGVTGISEAQKVALQALGAVET